MMFCKLQKNCIDIYCTAACIRVGGIGRKCGAGVAQVRAISRQYFPQLIVSGPTIRVLYCLVVFVLASKGLLTGYSGFLLLDKLPDSCFNRDTDSLVY